ncbi:unnamed protein product [Paramecium sonneborni]|uniref:HTH La-type RNA-binding domain-containing protein n=1 Tax=Paramecium sonneborni TaxID=65129 RepID=A0A8S1R3P4_9CILI|nr:unnamed protein product [Paramecium sonneborni]
MKNINQFQSLDCQLGDQYDPTAKIVVQSRQEKDDYLLPKICKQIEFYLGDANLLHDNYFRRLLQENQGWVPLEAFLECNKIKVILQNYPKGSKQQVLILIYALKRSEILQVDEDRNMVKRKIAFVDNSQFMDERTIYVENIPSLVDQQMLHQIFNRQIDSISKEIRCLWIHYLFQHRECKQGHTGLQQLNSQGDYGEEKQGESNLVMIKGGLRVMSKIDWLNYKNQCKQLKQKKNNELVEEPVKLKIKQIQTQDLRIEELRIAVGHAVNPRLVKHINIESDTCIIECVNQLAADSIKFNICRIQNYDDRFYNSVLDIS